MAFMADPPESSSTVLQSRARAGLITLFGLAAIAGLLWTQPYSVFSGYRAYTEPARRFLQSALAGDSVGLERQAASAKPVQWALEAARQDPQALAVWARGLRPYSGEQVGDTAMVVFQTSTRVCYLRPVTMVFIKGAEGPRVFSASSSCFTHR
jgi:hypothetical protein